MTYDDPLLTMNSREFSAKSVIRLAWRHVRYRPLQSLFFVVGVAVGVAMIVAIDLANGSAARAFQLGTETVAGRATHQIVGGPSGLDQTLYTDLRRKLGFRSSAPVVEQYVIVDQLDAQPMRLLGVDPFAEAPFRSYLGSATAPAGAPGLVTDLLVQPDSVLLSQDMADRYGLDAGDALQLRLGTERATVTIAGLLVPADELSQRALAGLLIADIAVAQEVLNQTGRLSRIDLLIPEGAEGARAVGRDRDAVAAGRTRDRVVVARRCRQRDDRGISPELDRSEPFGPARRRLPDLQYGYV